MDINATLIGQGITFFVFILVTMKYVWPPIQKALADREAKIADGIAAAEKAQRDLDQAEQRSAEMVSEGKQQAADIVGQAHKRRDDMIEEAKNEARTEADRIKAAAKADAEQQVAQAREQLKLEVSKLALAGAEQVLMREVDKNAHNDVLAKITARL